MWVNRVLAAAFAEWKKNDAPAAVKRPIIHMAPAFFDRARPAWLLAAFISGALAWSVPANDYPQWGEPGTRNMVSAETNLPDTFDVATGKNIKWSAQLGTESYGTPIIAQGRVFIGCNNDHPRDPKHQGDRGVLLCFNEADGAFLWQWVVPKRELDKYLDWPKSGMTSTPSVEHGVVYMLNNRGEIAALDLAGMANGNDGPFHEEGARLALRGEPPMTPGPTDADVLWLFDLVSGAGIYSHDSAHASPLIDGPFLYLNSCNGVDNTHRKIRAPEAPSVVVLDKKTGRLVARDREHIGPRIFHCTWSSPSLGVANGRRQIIFGGGDGVIYAFEPVDPAGLQAADGAPGEPATLKKIWQFDCDPEGPKEDVHRYSGNRKESPSNIKSIPVCHGNRVYVTVGGDLWWGKEKAWLKCIDATQTGEVTKTAEVWSYPLRKHCMGTPAIGNGLVLVGDNGRRIHCVNAETGQPYWTHDIESEFWASPLIADGKVYFCGRGGEVLIFAASAEKKLLANLTLDSPISATPVAANGVLYLATATRLYAIKQ
jgi:outer membrane protein assembly factor BamB